MSLPESLTALLSFFPFYLLEARENKIDLRIVLQMLWPNVEDVLFELVVCAVFTSFGNKPWVQKEKTASSILGLFAVFYTLP